MKRISTAIRRGALLLLCMALLPVCASAETFYATSEGTYYHLDSHCQGMQNASRMPKSDAVLAGKQPCTVCITATCYATLMGSYCHRVPDCSGMQGAYPVTMEGAIIAGKELCPRCFQ